MLPLYCLDTPSLQEVQGAGKEAYALGQVPMLSWEMESLGFPSFLLLFFPCCGLNVFPKFMHWKKNPQTNLTGNV